MRFLLTHRLLFILIIIISLGTIFIHIRKPTKIIKIKQTNEVEQLLEQLFDSSKELKKIQSIWNKLIKIWKKILLKFVIDACQLCHQKNRQCKKTVDIDHYIYYINKSFYPINDLQRPNSMGLYYDFDLKLLRSLNNSILSTDVTPCDYFHMFQLMINVQIVLHEKEIDYFLTKGTLIGSLRHHDLIPWDTDIDIFIPNSAVLILKNSFQQLDITTDSVTSDIHTNSSNNLANDEPLHRKDLVLYQFRNVHRVTSYKIFSIRSSRVNGTHYRWPKIDIFPYQESFTHIFAYPRHRHNLGTMNYLARTDVFPLYLRPLGPLLVPSPRNLRRSLKAMVQLGRSSVFYVCEGNTFLHRQNRASTETWRIPCRTLITSYPFVQSERNSTNGICTENVLLNNNNNKPLSLFKYRCDEHLSRTLN